MSTTGVKETRCSHGGTPTGLSGVLKTGNVANQAGAWRGEVVSDFCASAIAVCGCDQRATRDNGQRDHKQPAATTSGGGKLSWDQMTLVFATQFAGEIAAVVNGGGDAVLRDRLAALGPDERRVSRDTLDELATA